MRGAIIGIPSPEFKLQIIKQNSPRTVFGMDSTRCFGQAWSVIVGGGVNLYFYRLGTATNVFSMEHTDN